MLKSKFIKALSLTGAILFAQTTWATPPSDELVKKYIRVMKTSESVNQEMKNLFKQNIKTNLTVSILAEYPDLTIEQQEKLERTIDKFAQSSTNIFFSNEIILAEMNKQPIDDIKRVYTTEELQALIQFYETPLGQKIIEKQGLIANSNVNSLQNIQQKTELFSSAISQELEELSYLFYDEVEKIVQRNQYNLPSVDSVPKTFKPSQNKK